jgi:hypothetical protein
MSNIHDEILSNMSIIRQAIAFRYKWYYHVTPSKNAENIRNKGLLTNRDKTPPTIIVDYIKPMAHEVICLSPLGADIVPPPVQGGPFICLAISTEYLPRTLTLDWSFSGAFELAEVLRHDAPERSAIDIFLECAKRRGAIMVYEQIPRTALHAFCKLCTPHDPKNWPLLVDCANEMLLEF